MVHLKTKGNPMKGDVTVIAHLAAGDRVVFAARDDAGGVAGGGLRGVRADGDLLR